MALNRSSKFGAIDDLDFSIETQQVHEVQQIKKVKDVPKEIGTTQGKKGQKLKRINMAFSDLNHEYITKESRRQGMTATAFVNMIIEEYRKR